MELWHHEGWRLKVYTIASGRPAPRQELIEAAKRVALDRLGKIPASVQHHAVGFLGIHDGKTANFVFLDFWADENELHHHVYVSSTDEPTQLTYATPTGLAACVWDLRLMAFERQAWVDAVLKPDAGADIEAYLNMRLNEDV